MNILFVISAISNGSRLRIINYLDCWKDYGINSGLFVWDTNETNGTKLGNLFLKECENYDIIFLYRSLIPSKILQYIKTKRKLVFDFDDAIFYIPKTITNETKYSTIFLEYIKRIFRIIKRGNAFYSIRHEYLRRNLKHFDLVVVCNKFLKNYALKYCDNVFISPTPLEKNNNISKIYNNRYPLKIGWIGTMDNQRYLVKMQNIFSEIKNKYGDKISLKIISQGLKVSIRDIKIEFAKWSLETECDDIIDFDIGIMPLTDDGWSRGKCSYKAIQMMSYGIPVVISPVGMNRDLIKDGINGYLASDNNEWCDKLSRLIEDCSLRDSIGKAGIKTVNERFTREHLQMHLSEELRRLLNDKK